MPRCTSLTACSCRPERSSLYLASLASTGLLAVLGASRPLLSAFRNHHGDGDGRSGRPGDYFDVVGEGACHPQPTASLRGRGRLSRTKIGGFGDARPAVADLALQMRIVAP